MAARGHPLETALVVALMCGLRLGEMLAFHWDDVDLDVGLLRVRSAIVRPGGRVEIGPTKTPTSRRQLRLPGIAVADLLGHASTRVTSVVYWHRTTPTVEAARDPMDRLFGI